MKSKVYCNKQDCTIRKTFIGDTGEYSRNLCCNVNCVLVKDGSPYPEATISGWVAVDDFDNAYIYHSKPTQRCKEFCDTGDYVTYWMCESKYPNGKECYLIDKDFFSNLTPESEPIPVEIIIKPKKQ